MPVSNLNPFLTFFHSLRLPASGDVQQDYRPITTWFSPQIHYSGNLKIEAEITEKVAGYGRQLGILTEVLAEITESSGAVESKTPAMTKFVEMKHGIDQIKKRHKVDLESRARDSLEALLHSDPRTLKALLDSFKRKAETKTSS